MGPQNRGREKVVVPTPGEARAFVGLHSWRGKRNGEPFHPEAGMAWKMTGFSLKPLVFLCERDCWNFSVKMLKGGRTRKNMKILLLIPALGLALLSISCRVTPPLDPMTMKPSDRCPAPGVTVVTYSGK
jgi:hypothetical protein